MVIDTLEHGGLGTVEIPCDEYTDMKWQKRNSITVHIAELLEMLLVDKFSDEELAGIKKFWNERTIFKQGYFQCLYDIGNFWHRNGMAIKALRANNYEGVKAILDVLWKYRQSFEFYGNDAIDAVEIHKEMVEAIHNIKEKKAKGGK